MSGPAVPGRDRALRAGSRHLPGRRRPVGAEEMVVTVPSVRRGLP